MYFPGSGCSIVRILIAITFSPLFFGSLPMPIASLCRKIYTLICHKMALYRCKSGAKAPFWHYQKITKSYLFFRGRGASISERSEM